jgi:hypothetical protein
MLLIGLKRKATPVKIVLAIHVWYKIKIPNIYDRFASGLSIK